MKTTPKRAPTPAVEVLIPGLARCDVVTALIDQAIALEAEAASRKRKTTMSQAFLLRAERLRAIAAEVQA